MRTIKVDIKRSPYKIFIGSYILPKLGNELKKLNIGNDAIIITNPSIKKLYLKSIEPGLLKNKFSIRVFEVPEGEMSKSFKYAFNLINKIASYDVVKRPFIIALGGGVIGDLAGFVAAVYKRGIPYVQVPTTLLAQVDSSIGGKVAIDIPLGKNLVGSFYQPKLVWSDISTLLTLNKRQIINGLAEIIKYGVISDKKLFNFIDKNKSKLLSLDLETIEKIVFECGRIKAKIVSEDEKEKKGIRTFLNFGHTIGHAIEAAGKYGNYQHGEAVALGMRIAAEISHYMNKIEKKELAVLNRLLSDFGLPEKIKKTSLGEIKKIINHDKKFSRGKNRFVLVDEIGKVSVVEGVPINLMDKIIKRFLV